MSASPGFLSCDWGTTSLRLRLSTSDGQSLSEFRSDAGAASLAAAAGAQPRAPLFENALRQAIAAISAQAGAPLDGVPVVISGMASSSIGWMSPPYARLPFNLDGADVVRERLALDGRAITLISGVRDELDVMRGEETELIGLMQLPEAARFAGRCLAILPGTHSKHVDIVDGRIISFRTAMTGELFAVLANHSVLRHSVRDGEQPAHLARQAAGAARSGFIAGVREALANDLSFSLFHVRTRQLLRDEPSASNAGFLSGVLIGAEAAALRRRCAAGEAIALCAGSAVAEWYRLALAEAGLEKQVIAIPPDTVDRLSILGHAAIQHRG